MYNEKTNQPKLVPLMVVAITLFAAAAISMTTTENAYAYKKNQATSQTSACGNEFMPTNVGCQNTDSLIQGDENVVALTSQQTFPALTEESSSSPPTQSEEICNDGLDNDGDGATDLEDTDCEKAPPPLEDSEPLEQ
jgi:hypothetical protein